MLGLSIFISESLTAVLVSFFNGKMDFVAICYIRTILAILIICRCSIAFADEDRWWPEQTVPKSVVRTREHGDPATKMLVQSIAGLAAKAVNQGQGEEMVWVFNDNHDMKLWYEAFLKHHPGITTNGTLTPWELVNRFAKRDVIKGYILYSQDKSPGRTSDHRDGMDRSVNVATSLAGIFDGVVVEERLEQEAIANGLTMLVDVRGKSQSWCFETYKDRFNRRLLCAQDPRISNLRDLAVAQQALVLYGADEPMESAMNWLEPLSPIAGWNGGDEFKTTRLSTIYGHVQTATDWCMNLPILMSGSDQDQVPLLKKFDPGTIDWNDGRSCVSFILTDGDNVQWFQSSFFHGNTSFWNSPSRGKIPFGWSCCFASLAQVCPVAMEYGLNTQKQNDQFIEWGGGYYYPDLFAKSRPNRDELLAKHASRTWKVMQRTGTRMIGFNVANASSAAAIKAYETIAGQTNDLSAILVFQYSPYEAGAGKTFWVKDRRGIEIPVITARYSIWEHSNHRPRSGTPAKVAREIRDSASGKTVRHDWVIVHAWSYYQQVPGTDENSENLPQEGAPTQGGIRGYEPALWCSERLPPEVHTVTPEELVWRIRMEHDAVGTRQLLEKK